MSIQKIISRTEEQIKLALKGNNTSADDIKRLIGFFLNEFIESELSGEDAPSLDDIYICLTDLRDRFSR